LVCVLLFILILCLPGNEESSFLKVLSSTSTSP
jgi:hypothetical protein